MNLSHGKKNVLSLLMRLVLSGALLAYIFTKIDRQKTIEVLLSADLSYIVMAGAIFLFIHLLIIWRWFVFIRALELTVSTKTAVRYFFIGLFGNLFMPTSIGGDVIKILGLCRETPQKVKVVASVLLDRLSGFGGIVLLAVGTFILGYRMINYPALAVPIGGMALSSILAGFILFNEPVYHFFCTVFNRLPRVKQSLMNLHYNISLLKDKRAEGLKAVVISSLSQAVYAVTFFLQAKALHQDIGMVYFLVFIPLISVACAFPSIGGLGVREAGAAYLFAKIGVEPGIAVSIALINFLFMVIIGLAGGIIYVFTLSPGRVQREPSVVDVRAGQSSGLA